MTVLGFGWYNYAKLQQQPARDKHGKHGSAEAQRLLEPGAGAGEAAEAEVAAAAAVEPGDALASLPPGLRAALEFAMERLVRWGLADALFLTASLASSLPLNLAMYVGSQLNTEQPNPNPNPNPSPSPYPNPYRNPSPPWARCTTQLSSALSSVLRAAYSASSIAPRPFLKAETA